MNSEYSAASDANGSLSAPVRSQHEYVAPTVARNAPLGPIVEYEVHALLALADGLVWGERSESTTCLHGARQEEGQLFAAMKLVRRRVRSEQVRRTRK